MKCQFLAAVCGVLLLNLGLGGAGSALAGVEGKSYALNITQCNDEGECFDYADVWTFNADGTLTTSEANPAPEIYSDIDILFICIWQASTPGTSNTWLGVSIGPILLGSGETTNEFGEWSLVGFED